MKTDKTKSSLLNAIMMIIQTGVISILSLISTNLILKNYGSDFNGVVATANQFINLLLIVEGGFSLAINVALFKPFVNNDQNRLNAIMAASKKIFFKIGFFFLLIGIILSVIYPLFIKSELDYITIFLIFLMVISSTAFSLLFVIKSQIMFQVSQKEYIYSFFGTLINLLASLTTIFLVYNRVDLLFVRLSLLLFSILNGITIIILYKKYFPKINDNVLPDFVAIKGTKDIMVQKLTSVIYLSSPLLFISTFIDTKIASVYAVYTSIYNIIKMFLTSVIAAPVNGFGQLLSSEEKKNVYDKFKQYEYIIILSSSILISSVLVIILPFIKMYTINVTDVNYVNNVISIMLAVILFLEIIHIPSGNIINMNGDFKVAKKIQIVACIVLITSLTILGYLFGIYGILIGTIVTNTTLCYMEISYTHRKIFNSGIRNFITKLSLNIIIIVTSVFIGRFLLPEITNYIDFFVSGFIILIIISIILVGFNYIFFKKDLLEIKELLKKMKNKIIKKGE